MLLAEKRGCSAGDVRPEHVVLVARIGEFFGVEPDAGRVTERPPGRLGEDARFDFARLNLLAPGFLKRGVHQGDVEAVHAGGRRPVEVHLAEGRRLIARGL